MAKPQPTVERLVERFAGEVDSAFYPFIVMLVIQRLENPSLSEIRQGVAKLAAGKYIQSEASDKQLLGRMDKTFGLIDCVGGAPEDRRYRVNRKGARLLKESRRQVLDPLFKAIADK